jgi:hypothetical protein
MERSPSSEVNRRSVSQEIPTEISFSEEHKPERLSRIVSFLMVSVKQPPSPTEFWITMRSVTYFLEK